MEFLIGFLGALMTVVLLAVGTTAGWLLRRESEKRTVHKAPRPGKKEEQQLMEQQQAFQCLQNYSAERAYGMAGDQLYVSRK